MSEAWHIYGCGPSVLDAPTVVPDDHTQVAVNAAIALLPWADYWACYERPEELWDRIRQAIAGLDVTVWCRSEDTERWGRHMARLDVETLEGDRPPKCGVAWRKSPILSALWMAVARGAEVVHLWGVDLVGTVDFDGGYAVRQGPRHKKRRAAAEDRWEIEHAQIVKATKYLAKVHGVLVHRRSAEKETVHG